MRDRRRCNTLALGEALQELSGYGNPPGGRVDCVAYVVSRRRFTGYWEYDRVLFTAPPRFDHSGAAARSLRAFGWDWLARVGDALNTGVTPGNMFSHDTQPVLMSCDPWQTPDARTTLAGDIHRRSGKPCRRDASAA
jgi:hypothetical protein